MGIFDDQEFLELDEPDQIRRLQKEMPEFAQAMERDPRKALAILRRRVGREEPATVAGEVIRQFAAGVVGSAADTAQFFPEAAEWAASKVGSDWETGADEAIEAWKGRNLADESSTAAGRIARGVGEGVGLGAQAVATGGLMGAVTKLPMMGARAAKVAKAGKWISGGAKVELTAGAAAGGAGAGAAEVTDNAWLQVGAAVLAGGAMGLGVAARQASKARKAATLKAGALELEQSEAAAVRAGRGGDGPQPPIDDGPLPGPSEGGPARTPAGKAAEDAYEGLTVAEQKLLLDEAAKRELQGLGGPPSGYGYREFNAADEARGRATLAGMNRHYREDIMSADMLKRLMVAGPKAMLRAGITQLDDTRTITSQIGEVIDRGLLTPAEADFILGESGLSLADLADVLRTSSPREARGMQMKAAVSRRFHKLSAKMVERSGKSAPDDLSTLSKRELEELRSLDPEDLENLKKNMDIAGAMTPAEVRELKELAGAGMDAFTFWGRFENIRRGMLVTQLATAMRNAETQIVNTGVVAAEDALDNMLHRLFPKWNATRHPVEALGTLSRLARSFDMGDLFSGFKRKGSGVDEVTSMEKWFAAKQDPVMEALRARINSDLLIQPGQGGIGLAEKATLFLNGWNRFQEFGIRRATFSARLAWNASKRGLDMDDIIKRGQFDQLPREDYEDAVNHALKMTYGGEFDRDSLMRAESLAGKFIDLTNNTRVGPVAATQVLPFPRFMMNAIRWQWEHAPFGARLAMSPLKSMHKLARGDTKDFIQATTGTAMFLSAYQIRSSEYAGEHWFEIRPSVDVARLLGMEVNEDGVPGTIDTRPYNPFSSYLFLADVIKRGIDGTLFDLNAKDVAMGVLSTNLRAGAGMYVMDNFLKSMAETWNGEEDTPGFLEALAGTAEGYAGSVWSGLLVPFQQLKDVAGHFDKTQAMLRDTGGSPLVGAMANKLPYAGDNRPTVELATREEAPFTAQPLLRQLTGITTRGPKNKAEQELDKFGFTRGDILPSSGIPAWDKLMAKHMGPIVASKVIERIKSDKYQKAPRSEQEARLADLMRRARGMARKRAKREAPGLYRRWKGGRQSKRVRRMNKERGARREQMAIMQREQAGG